MSAGDGRVVVVTGAAGGIGRATALRFAAEGARVAAWDVAPCEGLAEAVVAAGGQARIGEVDVTSRARIEEAVADLVGAWSRIDVLVNNAGILRDAQLVRWKDGARAGGMTDADFDAVLAVNVRGTFLCTQTVVPLMIGQRSGVILSAASVVAGGNFGQTNYVASKAAIIGMTRTWARELGRHGIRVNAVAPGFIDTPMARQVPAAVLDQVVARTPLGRMGTPEEVAEVYAWLASERARFVHGAVLAVDGGLVPGS
jgi:3-oxoacyl-[acyl-carrier protein] reductase